MNLISALIGIVALVAAPVGFIPFLGWLNWLVIPVVAIGLVLGLFSDKTTGRNINLAVGKRPWDVFLFRSRGIQARLVRFDKSGRARLESGSPPPIKRAQERPWRSSPRAGIW